MRLWLLVALLAGGCGLGDGTGMLAGTLYVRGCTHDYDYGALASPAAYDMNPRYFVADPVNALASSKPLHPINKVLIRVQPSGNRPDESDELFVDVADVSQVVGAVGGPMAIGPTSNVRATLLLNQTCPSAEVGQELDGTMTWTAFGSGDVASNGLQFGDHLAATFSFDIIDRRQIAIGGLGGVPTTPATGGHIDGSFDFVIRQGKAAQAF